MVTNFAELPRDASIKNLVFFSDLFLASDKHRGHNMGHGGSYFLESWCSLGGRTKADITMHISNWYMYVSLCLYPRQNCPTLHEAFHQQERDTGIEWNCLHPADRSHSHRSTSNPCGPCIEGLCASLQVVNDFQIYSQIAPTDDRPGYETHWNFSTPKLGLLRRNSWRRINFHSLPSLGPINLTQFDSCIPHVTSKNWFDIKKNLAATEQLTSAKVQLSPFDQIFNMRNIPWTAQAPRFFRVIRDCPAANWRGCGKSPFSWGLQIVDKI